MSGKAGSASSCLMILSLFVGSPGARGEGRVRARGSPSADVERSGDPDRTADVEVIGRGLHHRLVDLLEVAGRAVALDVDDIFDLLVARSDLVAEAEEAAQVELTAGLDLETVELDAPERRARDIANGDAGVERRHQQLLRVGRAVAAEQFGRLVGDDLVAPRDALAAERIAVD